MESMGSMGGTPGHSIARGEVLAAYLLVRYHIIQGLPKELAESQDDVGYVRTYNTRRGVFVTCACACACALSTVDSTVRVQ